MEFPAGKTLMALQRVDDWDRHAPDREGSRTNTTWLCEFPLREFLHRLLTRADSLSSMWGATQVCACLRELARSFSSFSGHHCRS